MTRTELIAALEKADGPSRELDAEIALFLGWVRPDIHREFWGYIPLFTYSIAAALTLADDCESVSIEIWTGSDGVRYGRVAIGDMTLERARRQPLPCASPR